MDKSKERELEIKKIMNNRLEAEGILDVVELQQEKIHYLEEQLRKEKEVDKIWKNRYLDENDLPNDSVYLHINEDKIIVDAGARSKEDIKEIASVFFKEAYKLTNEK